MDAATELAALERSVALATGNVTEGGGPFGAVVVSPDGVWFEGVNRVTRDLDPTAHAEVVAIRAACAGLGTFDLTGCWLACSCEPCPMCLAAALWARLDRVVHAADRHDAAAAGFDDARFHDLATMPRDHWPTPVLVRPTADRRVPFDAWRADPERIPY
jgi:tRNA(Arg) A34 adenosine deaminase TadA